MEHGFYHADRGYWQANGGDPADLLPTYPSGTIEVPLKPGADYEWQEGEWVYVEPPPVPEPVPEVISRRQFYQGLAVTGKISQAEALAAVKTATLPTALQTMVDGITDDDAKFEADMLLSGAGEFRRDHPLVMVIAVAQGMSEQDVGDFWRLCAGL